MYSFIKNTLTISINSILKKQIVVTLLFLILLASVVYCTAPTVTHHGLQVFLDGIYIKDPNTASIDPNGGARVKYLGVNTAYDPNFAIKGNGFTVNLNGAITAAADTDTTFTFGRGKMGYVHSDLSDSFVISHYDRFLLNEYNIACSNVGGLTLNAINTSAIVFTSSRNEIGRINSTGLTMSAGKTISSCNVEPIADDTYYLGKNDDDTAKAYKGVILKDTTNGKYYRIEVINGVVTATDLTD